MKAGSLDTPIEIQARTTAQDAIGQPLDTWTKLADVWADVRHGAGMESVKAGADVSVVKASIRIRSRTDVTNGMRVLVGAVVYEIEAVPPGSARQEFTDLVCKVIR